MNRNIAVYKMIDFSRMDGVLFLSIYYPKNQATQLTAQLRLRQNHRVTMQLPIKVYGDYIELLIQTNQVFEQFQITNEEVWDFCLLDHNVEVELNLGDFTSYMTDYYAIEKSLYIVKPYITGSHKLALYFKKEHFEFKLTQFNQINDETIIELKIKGDYISDIQKHLESVMVYFKERKNKENQEDYKYLQYSDIFIEFELKNDGQLRATSDSKKLFNNINLPLSKYPLDGFICLKDLNHMEYQQPFIIETTWRSKKYVPINQKVKACWFKNYSDAISICTNKLND